MFPCNSMPDRSDSPAHVCTCSFNSCLQITAYAHKDDNNRFIIKKWDSEPPAFFSDEWELSEPELVRHGDLVQ